MRRNVLDQIAAENAARTTPDVSIIILTKDGGQVFGGTLRSVLAQCIEGTFEVIVIDSGSADGTADAAERLLADTLANAHGVPGRVQRIRSEDFGHGRTRNLGCSMAQGSLVVFLSQDATPIGTSWLSTLLGPFVDSAVVGAFSRQLPREDARLPERFLLRKAYPANSSLRTSASVTQRDAGYILFSNAASALRRAALAAEPFDENLLMCEDAEWAVRLLTAGRTIAYVADARVAHSHSYTLRSILARNFDYAVSLAGLPGSMGPRSYLRYLRDELTFVCRVGGLREMPWLIGFEAARILGYLLGAQANRLPRQMCRWLSGYPRWFTDPTRERHAHGALADEGN